MHAAIRTADQLRHAGPVALLCTVVLSVGAIWFATATLAGSKPWAKWIHAAGNSAPGTGAGALARPEGTSGSSAYTITAIDEPSAGTGELEGTEAFGINASGVITGAYSNQNGGESGLLTHGYVRAAGGTFTSFDAPDAGTSPEPGQTMGTVGIGIDTAGDVVGLYSDKYDALHGFLREAGGTLTEFDDPSAPTGDTSLGTVALAINDSGQIAGFYIAGVASAVYHGFLRSASGTYTTIDAPGAGTGGSGGRQGTIAMAMNASGGVAGFYIDSSYNTHGFIYSGGSTTSFDVSGASSTAGSLFGGTIPFSIDAAGDVVGSYTDSSSIRHGFLRTASGTVTSFDAPGANTTSVTGLVGGTFPTNIDPTGSYITGVYSDSTGLVHGFVYSLPLTASAAFTTFSAPNAATSLTSFYVTGTIGFAANASGTVVGSYLDSSEVAHGFEYTPTATPTPTFSPAAGTYSSAQTVTIADSDSAATIYYTTDGSTPTVSSTKYTEPITVSSTETINAIAFDSSSGDIESAVATAAYTISAAANPTPALSSLSPPLVAEGGAAFTLTVNGSGFVSSSTVYWGTNALTTTYVSATQMTAQVTAADITSPGITSVTVQTPSPGGGTSNALQFEVDSATSGSVTPPSFTDVTATVAPGATATYPVTLPSSATDVSVNCLNLPAGATCSYSASAGAVSIATSATTPAGTYVITVVFTETLPGAASTAVLLLPLLLLPLVPARRRWTAGRTGLLACLLFIFLVVAAGGGCGGGSSSPPPPPQTHQVTSSGAVTLTVQ
jgi:hypothetical protein